MVIHQISLDLLAYLHYTVRKASALVCYSSISPLDVVASVLQY